MGVFEFKVGRKKPTPGELAKERLKVVLVHDRLKLNPELLDIIRDEILSVVSRRACDPSCSDSLNGAKNRIANEQFALAA
jgi:cell division topological specificity factor MinE